MDKMNPFFEMKPLNSHRNSIPRLKFYDTQHMFHHEYFSSRHNSSAAIMTTSTAGSATGSAISPGIPSRRPDIIKVCSKKFHFKCFYPEFSIFLYSLYKFSSFFFVVARVYTYTCRFSFNSWNLIVLMYRIYKFYSVFFPSFVSFRFGSF